MSLPPAQRRRHISSRPSFHPGFFQSQKPKHKKCLVKSSSPVPVGPFIPLLKIPADLRLQFLFMKQGIQNRYDALESEKESIREMTFFRLNINIDIVKYENRLKRLRFWVRKDQHVRSVMKRFVQLWLYKRYKDRFMNTEDPATLMEPRRPIFLFDPKMRGSYVFDAFSLRKSIQMNLSFTDWMFPEPSHPKNPLTNLPFTMPQTLSIFQQLRAANATSWWIEAYYQSKFDLNVIKKVFCIPLKLNSLTELVRNRSSEEYIEYLQEFIEEQFDAHDIEFNAHLTILKWGASHLPNDVYMVEWAKAMFEFKKVRILYSIPDTIIDHVLIDVLYPITLRLFNKTGEIARLGRLRLASIPRAIPPPSQQIMPPPI
jgi:hypothetical protein